MLNKRRPVQLYDVDYVSKLIKKVLAGVTGDAAAAASGPLTPKPALGASAAGAAEGNPVGT